MAEHAREYKSVHQALADVKAAVGAVGKGQKNAQQGFNFRGVDDVVNAAAPALNDNRIVIMPEILDFTYETVEVGRNKTQMGHVTGKVAYVFWGPLGDSVRAVVPSEAMDSGDKAIPKFMSVAYRIALLQVLNLPTDEPDPDSVSYERSSKNHETTKIVAQPETAIPLQFAKEPDFGKLVESAKNSEDLNKVWKAAGDAGVLDHELVLENDEKITLRNLLYRKNDDFSVKKSPSEPEANPSQRKVAGKR